MTGTAVDLVVGPDRIDRLHLLDDAFPLVDPDSIGKAVEAVGHALDQRQAPRLANMRNTGLAQLHSELTAAIEAQHDPITLQRMPILQEAEIEAIDRRTGTLLPVGALFNRIAHLLGCGARTQHSRQRKRGNGTGERMTDALIHSRFSGNDFEKDREKDLENNRDPDSIDRESSPMTPGASALSADRQPLRWLLQHAFAAAALALLSLSTAAAELETIELPAGPGALAPRLAVDPTDGSVLLTWLEPDQSGHALRYSTFIGGAFSAPRTITSGPGWFVNWADTPALHPAPDGSWTAHWLAKSADSTYAYDIELARSTDRGASWVRLPNPHRDGTKTEHGFVSHFTEVDGGLGLVWLDGRNTAPGQDAHDHEHAGAMTLRTATIGIDGTLSESLELDGRVCDCCQTASAETASGPVVVYRDRSLDDIRDIAILRRVDGRWTEPEPVHSDGWKIAGCPVNGPAIAAAKHALAVAWFTMAGQSPTVKIAFSNNAGRNFSRPQEFSAGSAIGRVDLVRLGRGWAMSWMEQTRGQAHLQLAVFDNDGTLLDRRALTRLDGGRISGFPQIASRDGQLLVVWTGSRSGPDSPHGTELHAAIHRFSESAKRAASDPRSHSIAP